jgi:hypothetical protein
MSNGLTWAIVQTLKKPFTLLMQQCVHKQLYGYWLLYDALNVETSINIKLQDEYICQTKVQPLFICGKFKFKLEIPYMWMAAEAMNVLQPFLSFASIFESHRTHNMLDLILDPMYKNLQYITIFVGMDKNKIFFFGYDKKVMIPMLIKAHQFLELSHLGLQIFL